jgi:S-DNA-T family DNA segregation ATPase FtsK/SpoIIIE
LTLTQQRLTTLRNCRLVAALVLCTIGWVSILTFDVNDWPNSAIWPAADPVHNGCGRVGSWIAFQLFHTLGEGVYPLFSIFTLAAALRLVRREISGLALRSLGLFLVVTMTSTLTAMARHATSDTLIEGPGGILGIAFASLLTRGLSHLGAGLVIFACSVIGLLLTFDDVLLRIPSAINWIRGHVLRLNDAARVVGAPRTRLTPVMMGAGNDAGLFTVPIEEPKAETPRGRKSRKNEEAAGVESSVAGVVADSPTEIDDQSNPGAPSQNPRSKIEESDEESESKISVPERELIIKMLGKDRVEGKIPKSVWPTELGDYTLPPLSLLRDPESRYTAGQETVVREKAAIVERTLAEFRIEVKVVEIDTGPVITMFELELSAGTKVSQINSLANDIARALKAPAVRVVAPIPGKNTIGIEVPNIDKEKVRIKELIMLGGVKPTKMALPVFIGKNASGDPLIVDIATMPHMLVAGTTGSGKSVAINTLIMSILMTQRPDHVKLILIDPKMVELSIFKEIPHLMCPIVTDMQRAEMILQWATTKMDERYELLAEAGVRDIATFNKLGKDEVYNRFQPTSEEEKKQIPTHLPYITIVIDELADLMMTCGKEVEFHLSRLAQKSRAVGIHLIVATQRPQANVVTGLIKSNLPCRMAFRVASRMDSRIVLDQNGAEVLMGEGDMLFLPPGTSKLVRAQGTYVEDDEVKKVIADLATKARPQFHHELQRLKPEGGENSSERDPLFDQAVSILVETKRGSVSLLQRRLEIGYSRASRLIDQMASAGIVGEYKGSQAREVLITGKEWDEIRRQRDREVSSGNYRADMESSADDKYGTADLEDDDSGVPDLINEAPDLRD